MNKNCFEEVSCLAITITKHLGLICCQRKWENKQNQSFESRFSLSRNHCKFTTAILVESFDFYLAE